MQFKLRAMDSDSQNPVHHPHSSSYHFFSEQSVSAGYPNDNLGGGRVGQDMIRRRFEMRDTIWRELEKERIREEILAEEMARRRVLEAEVRYELMMERQMAMCEPKFVHRQLTGPEEKLIMSIDEKYKVDGHFGEFMGVSVSPVQLLGDSPKIKAISEATLEDNNNEVIVLNNPNMEALSGTKRKSTPPVSEGSSQPSEVRSKKKVKEEWTCAVCQISTTSEHGLAQHIQGKKHQVKEAALVAQKTGATFGLGVATNKPIIKPLQLALTTINTSVSETDKPSSSSNRNEVNKKDMVNGKNKRDKFKFWCEMCQVGTFSERVMNDHKEGKRHSTRLLELSQKGKVDSEASAAENTCDTKDKTETESNQTVVVATVGGKVKTVEDDMAYVAAVAVEANILNR